MTARTTAEQRADISRTNGRRSHGPVSTEGKCRSRMNAIKHGMIARIPVLPSEDEATFRQRVEGIVDSLAPRNDLELALAEQAALSLWKIERAERAEATRVTASLRAAEAQAEAYRQEELHALGRWLMAHSVQAKREAADDLLAFLPEQRHAPFKAGRGEPLVALLRIQATADGCRWLIDRWIALGVKLERNGDWDIEEMIEAVQLRGERPLYVETPDWEGLLQERCTKGNPAYVAEGRRQLLEQLTDGRPADPAGPVRTLRHLVEEEVARLEELEEARREREEADRSERADRLAVDTTPEGERVRRYQLDCDRKLHRAIQGVLKLRRGEGIGAGDDPSPEGLPEPEPGSEGEGTVAVRSGPGDGPESQADPIRDLGTRILNSSSPRPDPEWPIRDPDVTEPARAGVAAPAEPAAGPEGFLDPRSEHEPTAPAAAERIPQNEPGPLVAERAPRNEPSPPVDGDSASQNEPAGPGPMAGLGVPAQTPKAGQQDSPDRGRIPLLECGDSSPLSRGQSDDESPHSKAGAKTILPTGFVGALLILLATGLPSAIAGRVAGPIGRPSMTPAARAGPAARIGPLPQHRDRLDDAGQDIGRAMRSARAGCRVRKPEFREDLSCSRYSPGGLPRRTATAHVGRSGLDGGRPSRVKSDELQFGAHLIQSG